MKAKELAAIPLKTPEAELVFESENACYYDDPVVVGPVEDDNSEQRESDRVSGRPPRQLIYLELK